MTSRRSVQTWDLRVSRAFQFEPGHVSGRVASAQPIPERSVRVGIGARGSAVPPDAVPPVLWGDFPAGYLWTDLPADLTAAELTAETLGWA